MDKLDPQLFRNTLGSFASGVTVVTAKIGDDIHGMTANAFISVSLEPPLILVSVAKKATMHDFLQKGQLYGVSILADDQTAYSNHFAGWEQPGLEPNFFYEGETPLLSGAVAHLIAEVVDPHDAGDHTLYIAEVKYLSYDETRAPLVYFKGKYGAYQQSP